MYWYLNKQTNQALIFKKLPAITRNTGIEYESLKYQFSRKKRNEYDTELFRIVKTDAI